MIGKKKTIVRYVSNKDYSYVNSSKIIMILANNSSNIDEVLMKLVIDKNWQKAL